MLLSISQSGQTILIIDIQMYLSQSQDQVHEYICIHTYMLTISLCTYICKHAWQSKTLAHFIKYVLHIHQLSDTLWCTYTFQGDVTHMWNKCWTGLLLSFVMCGWIKGQPMLEGVCNSRHAETLYTINLNLSLLYFCCIVF